MVCRRVFLGNSIKNQLLSAGSLAVPFGNCSQTVLTMLQCRQGEDYNSQNATRQGSALPILIPFTLNTFSALPTLWTGYWLVPVCGRLRGSPTVFSSFIFRSQCETLALIKRRLVTRGMRGGSEWRGGDMREIRERELS